MTGPEHYAEAEGLLRYALNYDGLPNNDHIQAGQAAQVHATLALADQISGLHATLNEALGEINEELYAHRRVATS